MRAIITIVDMSNDKDKCTTRKEKLGTAGFGTGNRCQPMCSSALGR